MKGILVHQPLAVVPLREPPTTKSLSCAQLVGGFFAPQRTFFQPSTNRPRGVWCSCWTPVFGWFQSDTAWWPFCFLPWCHFGAAGARAFFLSPKKKSRRRRRGGEGSRRSAGRSFLPWEVFEQVELIIGVEMELTQAEEFLGPEGQGSAASRALGKLATCSFGCYG